MASASRTKTARQTNRPQVIPKSETLELLRRSVSAEHGTVNVDTIDGLMGLQRTMLRDIGRGVPLDAIREARKIVVSHRTMIATKLSFGANPHEFMTLPRVIEGKAKQKELSAGK